MKTALRIFLIYIIIGFLWIYFSNQFVFWLNESYNLEDNALLLHVKGFAFITLTGILLFFLILRCNRSFTEKIAQLEEKKKLEENLHLVEARFRAFAHHGLDMVIMMNDKKEIFYVSPNVERILGYTPEEFKENGRGFIFEGDRSSVEENFNNILSNPAQPIMYTYRIIKKNGEQAWIEGTIINLLATPKVNAIIGNFRDITVLKEKEILLKELNTSLQKQKIELESSNAELQSFAYVASHDLQEPLRMVTSFLSLLEKKYEGQLDETANQYIHFAVDASARMKKLILDLLEFSKAGSAGPLLEEVDLNEVMNIVKETFSNGRDNTQFSITNEKLPVIKGNKTQMLQLFQNLVGNSLKYARKGVKPEIHLRWRQKGEINEFALSDNGIGIQQQYLDKIFVVFQRLHGKSSYGGTGVGLAICKKIVERHKGKIWAESVYGEGSVFRFTLPIEKGVEQ